MNIAIIIVSYGRKVLLQQTLESLRASGFAAEHGTITIVDNGSPEDIRSLLCSWQPYITNLLLLANNKGKPYAWNVGAALAQETCKIQNISKPDFFLFCDSDLFFHPNWYTTLVTAWQEHQHLPLGVISGYRWPAHPIDHIEKGATTQLNILRFPTGCCVFISAASFQINGAWDTKRLIRTVDTSYFRAVRERNMICASIHPESVIDHTGNKSRTWHLGTGQPKLLP